MFHAERRWPELALTCNVSPFKHSQSRAVVSAPNQHVSLFQTRNAIGSNAPLWSLGASANMLHHCNANRPPRGLVGLCFVMRLLLPAAYSCQDAALLLMIWPSADAVACSMRVLLACCLLLRCGCYSDDPRCFPALCRLLPSRCFALRKGAPKSSVAA